MMEETYKNDDLLCDSKEERNKMRLDRKKIDYLQREDNLDYKEAVRILKRIKTEKITFETDIGRAYIDSLHKCISKQKNKRVVFGVKLCCYVVILSCLSFFLVDGFFEYCSKRNMLFLQQRVDELKEKFATNEAEIILLEEKREYLSTQEKKDQIAVDDILPQYKEIFAENPYFYGWITIEDTGINYPVMRGPDNEYYLSHNMQNEYDKYGLLVMDTRCRLFEESPQYLVYGHNAQNGSMFGELKDYNSERYYELHPKVTFDTLYESTEYDIVSVFKVSMDEELDDLSFYKYTNFTSKEIYDKYIAAIKERSLYDTGIAPEFGDELLALVTCENSIKDGRYVVVAARGNE